MPAKPYAAIEPKPYGIYLASRKLEHLFNRAENLFIGLRAYKQLPG
jgi:hypothetical protein